jgi:Ca-activated chloride channel homolog
MIRLIFFGFLFSPFNGALGQSHAAHKALRAGDKAMERSNYGKAEQYYEQALQQNPKRPAAGYNLGNAQYNQGQYDAAAQALSNAVERVETPTQKADAYHNLGNSWYQQQKYDAALKAYEQSLRYRPGDLGTKQNLGMARKKLQAQRSAQQPPPQPPPPESGQQPNEVPNQNQPADSGQPRDESDEQVLQYIDREDKKNRRKYQDRTNKSKTSNAVKDW